MCIGSFSSFFFVCVLVLLFFFFFSVFFCCGVFSLGFVMVVDGRILATTPLFIQVAMVREHGSVAEGQKADWLDWDRLSHVPKLLRFGDAT